MPRFARLQERLGAVVTARLSDASVALDAGPLAGVARSCLYQAGLLDTGPFADAASVHQHHIKLWLAVGEAPPAEGDALTLHCSDYSAGVRARITTAVELDGAGWASFSLSLLA